jgi:hypothetical protein
MRRAHARLFSRRCGRVRMDYRKAPTSITPGASVSYARRQVGSSNPQARADTLVSTELIRLPEYPGAQKRAQRDCHEEIRGACLACVHCSHPVLPGPGSRGLPPQSTRRHPSRRPGLVSSAGLPWPAAFAFFVYYAYEYQVARALVHGPTPLTAVRRCRMDP